MSGGIVDRRVGDSGYSSGVSADDLDTSNEARARRMGWYPKDEFHGRPEDWIPADKFVERAEKELPILRENLRRLDSKTARAEQIAAQATAKYNELNNRLEEMGQTLESMRTMADTAEKRGFERAMAQLKKQAQEAAKDGDQEAVTEAIDKMGELMEARQQVVAPAQTKKPEPANKGAQQQQPQGEPDPVEVAWVNDPDRQWFRENPVMQNYANAIWSELVTSPTHKKLSKAELLTEVERQVAARYPQSPYFFDKQPANTRRAAPVNDGGDLDNRPTGNKLDKSFDALPAEAKAEFKRIERMTDARKGKPGYKPYTKAEFLKLYHGTEVEE